MKATENLPFALGNLHPYMVGPITSMIATVAAHEFTVDGTKFRFEPFEGLRLPARQYDLLARAKTTKAGPWQSAHQYGLAVDFACRAIDQEGKVSGWHWPDGADWDFLKRIAIRNGLAVPIKWDRGHVEHPMFKKLRNFVM